MSYVQMLERLDDKGYEALGSGAYAWVLAKRKRWAVKVGHDINDAWLDYAMMVMQPEFRDNPFVPKIRFLRINREARFYVAVIERLDKTINKLPRDAHNFRFVELYEAVGSKLRREFLSSDEQEILDKNPKLDELIKALKDNFRPHDFDYHSGNAMISYTGQFVITDPVHGSNGGLSSKSPSMKAKFYSNNQQKVA